MLDDAEARRCDVNLYNALNASTATVVEPRAGASFLRPRNILPPRIAELSATYTF